MTEVEAIVKRLEALGLPENVTEMERFAIVTRKSFGVPAPVLKQFAKEVKKQATDQHALAQKLWETGIYDARAVAFLIDDSKKVTPKQMDAWARDFDNWATVDGTCGYLFCRTPYAYDKVSEWCDRDEEFVKRAAFSLIAYLAVHDKKAPDDKIAALLPIIESHCDDDRNFVKKAVNWALRQIGKRSFALNRRAIETAERIKLQDTRSACWIASDALRELKSESVLNRLGTRTHKRA